MPLYMDIHTVDSDAFTVEDVVKAHMEDLAVQERFGVIQKKYWVNEEAKTLFCLMEGPNKEACNEVHKESHGNTACNIIEVSDDEFNLFLGVGTSVNDLAHRLSGELDTGYRTILLTRFEDFTCKYGHYINEIHQLIEQHKGALLLEPENDIIGSFIAASNAVNCAIAIGKLLKSIPDNIEFSLALASGRPVDEEGEHLFEETKKKVRLLSALGSMTRMYIDVETKALSAKISNVPKIRDDDFKIINNEDFLFLSHLLDIIDKKLFDPDFRSEDLNRLLGLSKSQTYRKTKAVAGIAPNQLIQELRLRQSLRRLKKKSETIAQIAYEVGFNSPTYYTRMFRKRYNLLPTSFAKLSTP